MGTPDTVRDLRGFAIKFFTDDGLFDILSLQTPTFFIRDPMMFPQLTHALKKNPVTNLKDVNMFWDFMSSQPETLLLILYLFGDQIPDCYRYMQGFSGSAYKFVNSNGDVNYVKFKWMPPEVRGLSNEEAMNLTATDPDHCGRDLYNAIANGKYPTWTLNIQVMSEAETEKFPYNPFDVTKLWPEDKFPYQEIGLLTLNRNPDNFFEQIEEIGFNPGHLVPGIELSLDKLLHGRMFIYGDTQRHRIGPNFEQMRVNRPGQVRVNNYDRDGPQTFTNQGAAPNYYPNRYGGPVNNSRGGITKYSTCGEVMRYYEEDNFSIPTLVYQQMDEAKKQFLINNLADDIRKAQPDVQQTVVEVFSNIGDLGSRLRRILDS